MLFGVTDYITEVCHLWWNIDNLLCGARDEHEIEVFMSRAL